MSAAEDASNVHQLERRLKLVERSAGTNAHPARQGGGNGGNMSDMEARVIKLEEFAQDTRDRLTRIETRLDQTATKADLAEGISSMVKWVVGTAVGLGVAGITVMTFVLNHATPKTAPSLAPTPIIINVPPSPPAAAQPPAAR